MVEGIFLFAGYVVGSIPTGFLLVRMTMGKDIRKSGSGKTGGYNTYMVTRSRWGAIAVGLLDALKGFTVALVAWQMYPENPDIQAAGIIGAVLGHNYPVWLKFRGGRGLATVAGALFALGQFLLVSWCLLWFGVYRWKKDILVANVSACVLSLIAVWVVPDAVISWFLIRDVEPSFYAVFISIILVLLLIGHYDGIRVWFSPQPEEGEQTT
jgi:glycerol-3-phosphate acyltransferase PlsY